jgi:hypothetical protein
MTTPTVGHGKEGLERLALLKRQCPWAKMFISDPDYTMVAIKAAN